MLVQRGTHRRLPLFHPQLRMLRLVHHRLMGLGLPRWTALMVAEVGWLIARVGLIVAGCLLIHHHLLIAFLPRERLRAVLLCLYLVLLLLQILPAAPLTLLVLSSADRLVLQLHN